MVELKTKPEYASLVSPLSETDYEALKVSIKQHGVYLPVVVNTQNEILDGHHRAKACQELGIEPPTILRKFDDPLLEKKFVIEANLKRRHLTDFQKVELGKLLEPIEKELAERRMKAGKTIGSDEPGVEKGKTTEVIAKKVGLSPTTFQRGKTILEKAPEEIKSQVRSGALSISAGYERTQGRVKPMNERQAPPPRKFKLQKPHRAQVIMALQQDEDTGKEESDVWVQGNFIVGADSELEVST